MSEELSSSSIISPAQASIFQDPAERELVEELRNTDLDELRPVDAFTLLHEWKERLSKEKGPEESGE